MDQQHGDEQQRTAEEAADERAVRSIELDTEDGGTVVIEQQNVGPANQVGGGEFKNVHGQKSPDVAAAEQAALQRDAPIDSAIDDGVEANEPA